MVAADSLSRICSYKNHKAYLCLHLPLTEEFVSGLIAHLNETCLIQLRLILENKLDCYEVCKDLSLVRA